MKVLFNASNVVKGGAIQAAVNFILSTIKNESEVKWFYILSKEVECELEQLNVYIINFIVINKSPSKDKGERNKITQYEEIVAPNVVFTLFGPAYVKFKSHHISGFANGWVTHSTLQTFLNTYQNNYLKIFQSILKYIFYAYHIRKADAWIFETETARTGFIKRLAVPRSRTYVVPNTCIDFGGDFEKQEAVFVNGVELHYKSNLFLALAANYPHKNISTLLKAVSYLVKEGDFCNFKLILTLEETDYNREFKDYIIDNELNEYIINIGKVNIAELPSLYSVVRCSILPSFIETFSAIYPESFSTSTPIITTNANFAKEICQNAAIYIDPKDPVNIAKAMREIVNNRELFLCLTNNGKKQFDKINSPSTKFQQYLSVIFDELV
ncbi:glycosyltransferase [Pseudoalteromonas haloplanktis]|uniref:Glycosyltransferase n=1 Tax=Pseudoalteromonas haloplanktis TaxID=228 RepID=A0ABU1BI85_PSEHA|nr:glycosyltransferase [Pseudoalteromonas haloplanktis]MDQ9094040.1 glycosyltransferase [Pseudoalteromonas haloplanktis]